VFSLHIGFQLAPQIFAGQKAETVSTSLHRAQSSKGNFDGTARCELASPVQTLQRREPKSLKCSASYGMLLLSHSGVRILASSRKSYGPHVLEGVELCSVLPYRPCKPFWIANSPVGHRAATDRIERKRQSNGIYAQASFGAEVEAWWHKLICGIPSHGHESRQPHSEENKPDRSPFYSRNSNILFDLLPVEPASTKSTK
jgi:hypothetical protein